MKNKLISHEALYEILKEEGFDLGYGDMVTLERAKEIFHPAAMGIFLSDPPRNGLHKVIFAGVLPGVMCVGLRGLEKLVILHNKIILCLEAEKRGALDVWGEPYEAPESYHVREGREKKKEN